MHHASIGQYSLKNLVQRQCVYLYIYCAWAYTRLILRKCTDRTRTRPISYSDTICSDFCIFRTLPTTSPSPIAVAQNKASQRVWDISQSSTVPQSSHNSSLSRNLYTRVLRWLFIKSYKTVEEIYLYKPIFVAKASDLHIGLPPLVIKVYHIFSY